MNKLHDLVESASAWRIKAPECFSKLRSKEVIENFISASKRAQCFDIGDWSSIDGLTAVPELCRMPYDVVWIEGASDGEMREGVFVVQTGAAIEVLGFCYLDSVWALIFVAKANDFASSRREFHICYEDGFIIRQEVRDLARGLMTDIAVFCSAINCCNVTRTEHKPSEKLQKARAKRGKAPLFSYWTLDLDLGKSREVGADLGGTHSPPRVHLRRGHPRQYAPGKYCWVQPCVVGNKALGMVHKDYQVRAA